MIDPKKLEAFAGGGSKPPKPAPGEGGEEDLEEGEGEGGEEEGGEESKDFGPLVELIAEYKDDVEQCVDELDGQTLGDPQAELEPEDQAIFNEGFANLDESLKDAAADLLTGIEFEQAQELADMMDAQGVLESTPERVAGWLFRVGQKLAGDQPKDQGEGGEDPPADEEGGEPQPPKKGQKPQD